MGVIVPVAMWIGLGSIDFQLEVAKARAKNNPAVRANDQQIALAESRMKRSKEFNRRLLESNKKWDVVRVRVMEIATMTDDNERGNAARALQPKIDALKKETDAFFKEFEDVTELPKPDKK